MNGLRGSGLRGMDPRPLRHELPALLAFRWASGSPRSRLAAMLAMGTALGLAVGVPLTVAVTVPRGREVTETVAILLPTAWLFFLLSVLVSAVGAAGGRELLPRGQAVAFPVSPVTDHAGALIMTPLNLAWTVQAVGLLTAAVFVTAGSPGLLTRAVVATLMWIVAASCLAQLAGWAAELLRTYPHGEAVLRALILAAVVTAIAAATSERTAGVLDRLPTTPFVAVVLVGDLGSAAPVLVGLAVLTAVAFVAAVPLVAAVSRRPSPSIGRSETRSRPRLSTEVPDRQWLALLDRRLVTRAAPLRRGLAVLTALPLAAAALVPLTWSGITILPALVASAAGLLYGVNAFALDGTGAMWRDSLPQRPREWLDVRTVVLIQVCGGCVAAVLVAAALRSREVPTAAEVVAVVCAAIVAVVQVASRCARWSVRRPFAAELRRSRDTPAPPVALARYSVTLAVATTLSGIAFAIAGSFGNPALPAALLAPFALAALWSLRRTVADFEYLPSRSLVTTTVAGA